MNFIIDVPIYNRDLMVSIGQTDAELTALLKEHGWRKKEVRATRIEGTTTKGLVLASKKSGILLRLRVFPETPGHYGTLAHEIRHATDLILHKAGLRFNLDDSDEAYAYLTGYLTTEIYSRASMAGCKP